MEAEIIIVCDGGCGRTTEGMTFETRAGVFEQVDESGVPKWTCPDCIRKQASERIKKFHAHLDVCEQCERHPFDLCPVGARLLKYAATGQQN